MNAMNSLMEVLQISSIPDSEIAKRVKTTQTQMFHCCKECYCSGWERRTSQHFVNSNSESVRSALKSCLDDKQIPSCNDYR